MLDWGRLKKFAAREKLPYSAALTKIVHRSFKKTLTLDPAFDDAQHSTTGRVRSTASDGRPAVQHLSYLGNRLRACIIYPRPQLCVRFRQTRALFGSDQLIELATGSNGGGICAQQNGVQRPKIVCPHPLLLPLNHGLVFVSKGVCQ